jgi:uncharacterized protein (TIGR00304 family)
MYLGGSENMKMNRFLAIAILLLICGIVLLGFSVAEGESSAGFFIVFPVLIGSGMSEPRDQQSQGQRQGHGPRQRTGPAVKGGGVVLIGPIPIIFGSDTRLTVVLAVMAIIMMILMMFFLFYIL